jgi:hypothetical protein
MFWDMWVVYLSSFILIFIYNLFNNDVSSADCTVSNGRMVKE